MDEQGRVVRGLDDAVLSSITPSRGAELYAGRRRRKAKTGKPLAVDSHRNILAEAKSFLKWCAGKKWIDLPVFYLTSPDGPGLRGRHDRILSLPGDRMVL